MPGFYGLAIFLWVWAFFSGSFLPFSIFFLISVPAYLPASWACEAFASLARVHGHLLAGMCLASLSLEAIQAPMLATFALWAFSW